jgi:CPA2 family monovalent cation:H+ antiporter-2
MSETIKKHFPNQRMLVKAENWYDAYGQMNAGMLHVYRETVDTALRIGVDGIKFLGYRTYSAQYAVRTFLKIDQANLKKLSAIKDTEEYIRTIKHCIGELEKVIQRNNSYQELVHTGWDEDMLIAEANSKNVSA